MQVRTTILGQKTDQARSLPPVYGIADEPPATLCGEQAGTPQRVEMMGKRRAWHLHSALDVVDAITLRPRTHKQPEDLEPVLLAKRVELFDVPFHYDLSSIIEIIFNARGKAC